MAGIMQGLLAEAKTNRFSSIKETLSEDDVASVWENLSSYIEKQMSNQKGVQIQSLGTFTFTQKKLDIGNNKFILIQRPVFNISEKLAQSQGLQYVRHHVPGQIPIVQLNFAAMSFESPYDRDTVESCVREILGAVQRAIGSKRNVELNFNGIGKLSIRDSRVKMKFYKDFINQMDGSGKLLDSMQNRPGTVDSVMSERCLSRAQSSNTVILPRPGKKGISNTSIINPGLAPLEERNEEVCEGNNLDDLQPMDMGQPIYEPPVEIDDGNLPPPAPNMNTQDGMEGVNTGMFDVDTEAAIRNIDMQGESAELGHAGPMDTTKALNYMDTEPKPDPTKRGSIPPSRTGSRMAAPMAMATGVNFLDDLVPSAQAPRSAPSQASQRPSPLQGEFGSLGPSVIGLQRQNTLHMTTGHCSCWPCSRDSLLNKPHPPAQLNPLHRSLSFDQMKPGEKVLTPPGSACGHPNAGQELCYLCHQRARRNIPVSFAEERKKREDEEDRLLQQYQYMKDAENTLEDQEMMMAKRQNLQKMAAFNLGVSEALHHKKRQRDIDFQKSYIFQRRPLTPPRIIKQTEYSGDLAKQVEHKDNVKKKRQSDEEFLERLEQVQLAEDLAVQREQFLKEKADEQERYKKALETQIRVRDQLTMNHELDNRRYVKSSSCSNVRLPFTPQAKTLRPFSQLSPTRLNEHWRSSVGRLRFKPLQVPARESDKEVFGKNDMTNEKMAERRRRAYDLFQEQQDLVAQKKRENILKRLAEQKEEEQVLERTRYEMLDDRANKFSRRLNARKRLEEDWVRASLLKKDRLEEDHIRALSPGILLHEQCDKYNRCSQCKRSVRNCGETNLWSESRYIPGSRLMV
ncbi:coiled-coil domain-containing protein 81-like isoform X3 [Mercenaria mercenaria]|uniref:coiled-coil domain-containing protein 81-like isoform X3 n=1 Tax=Mercenaria mercenaria TaxID=6596 RepID=UPI00234F9A1B|nr:coiled-coil domain-containing protein 81-like isoform X3 [Mercenaria mercenaria]